ncbi:siderophore-iron transporter Str1 [Cryptococcus neoformans Tu401-1]|nr:siderophore-iron transporter Str1 [Cryptococcus neoformans var. grubii Tu401-1]OXM81362.1 siderophore-iron transporter Str1 [Cryptococcus neoformans var. grubii Bt63]
MSRPSVDAPSVVSAINQRPAFERVATDHKDAKPDPTDLETNHLYQDDDKSSIEVEQTAGVTKIEALYLVFGNGWKLWTLWGSIALISIAYGLSQMTTYYYTAFATSAFGEHTVLGTISVITGIMAGVAKPFLAKLADLFSRPWALALSVLFYTIGYIVVAASKNVADVAGGEVIYTIGNTGLDFITSILLADITSLQWRGLVIGLYSLPFIPFAFVAGNIADGINAYSANGWRWGYGMFCIMIPCVVIPAILVLFWADWKAKQIGALSLASSTYAREKLLAGQNFEKRPFFATCLYYARRIDAVGLLLMGFAFGCILSPFTLYTTAKGGYKNPSLIALLVVGGVLFISFCLWEWKVASHPVMPKRVFNRTFICCLLIDWNYYLSGYLSDTYWSSWLYVVKDYNDKDYTYIMNILTVGLCFFSVLAGLAQRYTHRFKYLQLSGLAIRIIGMGLNYLSVNGNMSDGVIVMSRILISIGGGISVTSSQVACQGSVAHQDMALAMAILSLWTSIGGAIGSAISASVWNKRVPEALTKYLGSTHNSTEIAEIFGSIIIARTTEPRDLVITAYNEAIRPLYLAALIMSMLSLAFGIFTYDIHLGKNHNAIEKRETAIRSEDEVRPEIIAAKAKEVEEKIAAEVFGNEQLQAQAGYRDMSKLENSR